MAGGKSWEELSLTWFYSFLIPDPIWEQHIGNPVEGNWGSIKWFEVVSSIFDYVSSTLKTWIEVVSSMLWVHWVCFEKFHCFESFLSHLCFPSCFRDFTQNHCPNGRPKSIERKNWTPIHLKNEKTQFNSQTNHFKSNPLNLSQSDPNSTSTTHRLNLNHLKSSRRSILKFLVLPPGHLHPAVEGSMIGGKSIWKIIALLGL